MFELESRPVPSAWSDGSSGDAVHAFLIESDGA
jgi:hypothetical protein